MAVLRHDAGERARRFAAAEHTCGRTLHSSTSQLNVSAVCGIGGVLRGCLWVV